MSTEVMEKPKAKRVRRKKSVREYNNSLAAFIENVKEMGWTISCDDAIFNLGVKA